MFDQLPPDITNYIMYNLSLNDIKSMRCLCHNIIREFPWHIYFLNRVPHNIYQNMNIDIHFMKIHGKYLMTVNKEFDLQHWLRVWPTILEINQCYETYTYFEM